MSDLVLYCMTHCPYCWKVMRFMKQNGITIAYKDTAGYSENRQELLRIVGKTQVPCLIIDGKALYESDDIIEWLKTNWKKS